MKAFGGEVNVRLRPVERPDLPVIFDFQLDSQANDLAATHPRNASDFYAHWDKALADPTIVARSILVGDSVAGSISCFPSEERDSVGYWIGKEFWGQGIATRALELLLLEIPTRPLHARVAVTNIASLRVLQKCGFAIVGYQHSPGDDRFQQCEEAILELGESKNAQHHRRS